jgi:NAD kinase
VWPKKVERVLLVKRPRDEAATEWACRIAGHLSQNYDITTYVEPSAKPDLPNMPSYETLRQRADGDDDESFEYSWQPQIDMVITLGGDGTLLQAAALFRENTPPPPTCSFFSQGAIGFLSPHPPSEHERVFESILENRAIALPRLRIEFCVTTEQEWEAANAKPGKGPHVDRPVLRWNPLVNELVLKRAQRLSGVAEVECYVDGNLLAHFQGDGYRFSSYLLQ